MLLSSLLEEVATKSVLGETETDVTHVSHDSREVNHDGIFVAIVGAKTDGRRFAASLDCRAVISESTLTVKPGVTVILVEDARNALAEVSAALAGKPCRDMTMIGLTGTNGKTTTAWFLEHIALLNGISVGVVGTLGHRLNGTAMDKQDGRTTPEASAMHPMFKSWRDKGCEWVVMEVSSIGLSLKRVAGIQFDIAAWTNFSQDHLDFHANMNDYFAAKASLFKNGLKHNARSILNGADDKIRAVSPSSGETILFGVGHNADISASDINMTPMGIECLVKTPHERGRLTLPLIGKHNLENALTAIGCALSAGLPLKAVLQALQSLPQAPGRMERIEHSSVFVDYAHTPDALERALQTLQPICKGQLMVIIGCGGDRDPSKRAEMGRIAEANSDLCFITSDNPRSEDPQSIINDIINGMRVVHYHHVDRREAIQQAISEMTLGDVLLIAGKGHEEYQEINEVKTEFSDKQEAIKALGGRA